MKKLKMLGLALVALIVLVVAIGFVLPKEAHVTRSTVINAKPAAIYPHLISPKALLAWSPWAEKDPNAKWTFEGPESGVGAKYSWSGNSDVGEGSQTITAVVENKRVETALDFGAEGPAIAWLELEPEGDATKVTWGLDSDMDPPIGTYFGLLMDTFVGPDYEQGLAKLKKIVEG